jgi:antitoxin component of MazEF toxin-antitoxin module
MSPEERMKKEERLSFGTDIMVSTKNGKSSILRMLKRFKIKDLTRTLEWNVTDHSISDPDSQ